jgi:hypothetical protein
VSCVCLGRCGDYGWFVVDPLGHSGVFHLVSYPSQFFTTKIKKAREKRSRDEDRKRRSKDVEDDAGGGEES